MAKLFSTENDQTGGDLIESGAVTPEEAQVSDAALDVDADLSGADGVTEVAGNIEEGVDAVGDLTDVQELVSDAAEKGEGLTEVAAESIRLTISRIARRIGAEPTSVYSLYATENFASAAVRKPNTAFAAEGVKEFAENVWKKLKAALAKLWAKVKAFWEKHVSTLGRVKKALISAKAKVKASSGNLKDKAFVEKAPSSLLSAFAGTGDLDVKRVQEYIKAQQAFQSGNNVITKMIQGIKGLDSKFDATPSGLPEGVKIVGGETLTIKIDAAKDSKVVKLEVVREPIENKSTEGGMVVADKAQLNSVLDETISIIDDAIKAKADTAKTEEASRKALNALESELNKAAEDLTSEQAKEARDTMNSLYRLNAQSTKLQAIYASQNVKLAKAVLGFVNASLSQYK